MEHLPDDFTCPPGCRGSCISCDEDWPCEPARRAAAAKHKACVADWAARRKASPGVQMTMHGPDLHLPRMASAAGTPTDT